MSAPDEAEHRPGETLVALPQNFAASIYFIGIIRTPWANRAACPKRGDPDGPVCRLEISPPWIDALDGVDAFAALQILYWMHLARRDLTRQSPRSSQRLHGTFALRSPMRPNPIASSIVRLIGREGSTLLVRGLDCVDGTPIVDIKPDHCPRW
ncbi:tRNA (N6-threonylcarbamoyladenosine(37)-N6)-methyltransferase TrmO [Lichenihabitans sp. PAMC28606]|uniref:tRNA (N6-threonylcarbamoyladenosine(37)-N6)-methyltransferase TrmO n=1 Tax=Lichenihabitans sp. PAMC28606 TaxID=2880932 RepID=UPI001D0A84F8|nr:tRNA (N6-threonylcarbamoyladenosine(37)-N6)-methyltransferase TrmO [Lichenihabitans sp. PAMC28606]UDL95244.1 tRNA (N6-threonylcarbamoyladenosine(37)-N6)-methyltransferase TrmO [Lichenihabitans sp. PAMC28606]